MNRYLFDIETIPAEHRELFVLHNQKIQQAFSSPGKLARVHPGFYYVVVDGELVEIDRLDEGANAGQWQTRESRVKWYGDPVPTLKQAKLSLGIN